jgi:hypothetical protein
MTRFSITGMIVVLCLVFLPSCKKGTEEPQKEKDTLPPVEVRAEVDRATATTGDAIRYTLTAKSEPQIAVAIPEMGAQIAGLRIVDLGESGPIERDGYKIVERWYQLKADIVGSYIIPGAVFSYQDAQGKNIELKTAQIFIEVKTVIEDKEAATDIRDIKPLVTIPRDYTLIIGLSLAGLVLLILIGGGIYFYRTRYRKNAAPPSRPAHEVALEEIEQLQKEGLIKKGVYQEHYFRLSEIFRRYLERRFRFQAVEQTTEEILPNISNLTDVDETAKRSAQHFLYHTDLVKFAQYTPHPTEVDQQQQEAVHFICETKEEPLDESGTPDTKTSHAKEKHVPNGASSSSK